MSSDIRKHNELELFLPDKIKGPKKKKKLTKEEKAKLRAEELERIHREEEFERERLAKEAAEALEAARQKAEDDAKREVQEQIWRMEQLEHTEEIVSTLLAEVSEAEMQERQEKQWEQYMKCDGLPDPASPPGMHTYLHLWRSEPSARRNIEPVVEKTAEVLQLLFDLDELIETDSGGKLQPLWREVRQKVRNEQQLRLDEATYGLLRAASTMVASVDSTLVRYHRDASPFLTLTLHTDLAAPLSDAPPPTWNFEELGVSMQMPPQFVGLHAAARALWLRYDHYTDLCPSRIAPPPPDHHQLDMKSVALQLWQQRLEEKEQEAEEQANLAAAVAAEEEKRLLLEAETAKNRELGPPSAHQDAPPGENKVLEEGDEIQGEDEVCKEAEGEDGEEKEEPPVRDEEAERQKAETEAMIKETQPHELNLRKMAVLGGVLHLDLLEQPPQPRELNKNLSLTVLSEPLSLQKVHYYVMYVPPPPPEPGKKRLPEEIEAEIKLQELEFEKIAQVHISLPNSVLWFEPPIVVGWDEKNQYWSTEDLHDLKFFEEKQLLSFRAGRLGPLALAAFKYTNLPYQTWEMKPTPNGIVLSITAAVVLVEFSFKDGLVCLSQLQNGSTAALQDQIGIYFKPQKLIKIMRLGGVDVFPPHDAHCYMSAVAPKQRTPERHLYQCMAFAAKSHCFAWSRWNLLAGMSKMVLQMKEINVEDKKKSQAEYEMLLVTSQRSSVVQCTEVSQSFSDEPAPGMKFYADVLHLLLEHGSATAKSHLKNPEVALVNTVFTILDATKVLSFS
ncbi:dynein axonemal intermediate chain 7-like [Neocloeon triangulifer]|uniref:dynein axonemal intermediate chain 7-like n=1 Tax=Neocloeon triangulifer TaxID=2078957 RepID=UPI00286F9350|nr:dynein axonemal intermediate chain 7-like [Neocloeon triangulifer]